MPNNSLRSPLRLGWIGACPSRERERDTAVTAFANPLPDQRERAHALHGARACADYREMLSAGGFDAVVIKTPTPFHAEQLLAAVSLGLPVFCEKPLCRSRAELAAIQAALASASALVQANFELRVSAVPARMKQLVEEHAGRPVHFFWKVLDEGWSTPRHPLKPWKMDAAQTGGFINEKLCHYLDLAQWWLGSRVKTVSACAAPVITSGYKGIWDNVSIHGWCDSGATIDLSWSTTCPTRKAYGCGVIGDRGAVFWDWWVDGMLANRLTATRHHLDEAGRMQETCPVLVEDHAADDQAVATHHNRASLQDFVNRLLGAEPVGATVAGAEALEIVGICLAAEESARSQGRLVEPRAWLGR